MSTLKVAENIDNLLCSPCKFFMYTESTSDVCFIQYMYMYVRCVLYNILYRKH